MNSSVLKLISRPILRFIVFRYDSTCLRWTSRSLRNRLQFDQDDVGDYQVDLLAGNAPLLVANLDALLALEREAPRGQLETERPLVD